MQCKNCKVNISSEFTFAIKNNNCPACGKAIMAQENLVAFLSLQELLKLNLKNVDVDKIASLIVANFDVKQRFIVEASADEPESMVVVEDFQTQVSDLEQKKLQRLRDEALSEAKFNSALDDALTDGEVEEDTRVTLKKQASYNEILQADEDINFHDADAVLDKVIGKRQQRSTQNIINGGPGAFRRGS